MAKLPPWPTFWAEYLDYVNYTSPQVKEMIGGKVNSDRIKNTCAVRMSYAMNYVGIRVPKSYPDMLTLPGGDGRRYAIRVSEMRGWLRHELGKPDFEVKKKVHEPFDRSAIADIQGLIAFKIHFDDATGHLDVYTQGRFSSEYSVSKDYFSLATKISLWRCG